MTGGVFRRKDVWAGVLFVACGAFFLVFALDYPLGSTRHMGPGYFPAGLGALLIVFGAVIGGRAVIDAAAPAVDRIHLRPLLLISIAVLLFAISVELIGLPAAIVLAVAASGVARTQVNTLELALIAVVLAVGSTVVFIWGLGLPFQVAVH